MATSALDPTRIPDDVTAGTPLNVTLPAQPSPIDQAVANLINSVPSMLVYSVLFGLCIYLIRERKETTALLAGAVGPDMAATIMDTFVKGALSALETAARAFPGQADDRQVESLAREAGFVRVVNADGSRGWKPIEGAMVTAESASAVSNDDLFQKLAKERGLQLSKTTQVDGSTAYTLVAASAG